ncbi:hypothetical protein CBER1_04412 [Cercospora berteroae]|uniref:F-box domain-containing protein n=1 Tax=Cercospora berteroae TaxID=357750 RepID=A0A2S6CCM7_9PEZI|nr:hypothetical protein CBER1_04412 [Cercospora berteroae]
MASDDQCSVADDERVLLESARHSVHATSEHARAVKGNMGPQEQSFSKKSTEDRIATQTHDSVNSFRSPLHDATDLNEEKLATPTTTSAQKVFETAELLEIIMLQLDAKDLLTAQQVGREWRDGINGSMRLKRKLGIELDDVDKVFYNSPLDSGPDNPSDFPRFFQRSQNI